MMKAYGMRRIRLYDGVIIGFYKLKMGKANYGK